MPKIGDAFGQSHDLAKVQRGERRETERSSTRSDEGVESGSTDATDDVSQIRARHASLIDAAKNTPDVRADRVAQARERVQEGFYDQPEVRSTIADRLLRSFGLT